MLVLITIICQMSAILLIFGLLNIYSATGLLGRWIEYSSFVSKIKKKISIHSFLQSTSPYEYIVVGWILDPFSRLISYSIFRVFHNNVGVWNMSIVMDIALYWQYYSGNGTNISQDWKPPFIQEREHPRKLQVASCYINIIRLRKYLEKVPNNFSKCLISTNCDT